MPARDFQRSKLYDAEVSAPEGRRIENIHELRTWVNDVCRTPYVETVYGLWDVTVGDGRGRRKACGGPRQFWLEEDGIRRQFGSIKMPRWSRTERVGLHELCHVFTGVVCQREGGWHGPIFCRAYIDLMDCFMGTPAADALKYGMKIRRVKVAPASALSQLGGPR